MSETGHVKNIEHFQTMISYVTGYGLTYDPSNDALKVIALGTQLAAATTSMDGVTTARVPWKVAVNDRENAYDGIRKLGTRIVNNFAASGADQNAIDDAKAIKRKLDGARAKALPKPDPVPPEGAGDEPGDDPKHISVSQQSFTQVVEHFDELIAFLADQPTFYKPNEDDLKIVDLEARSADMKNANAIVTDSAVGFSNARITRNKALYSPTTGLCDTALMVKKYVKSIYGADSPEYKQISALQFTKIKI